MTEQTTIHGSDIRERTSIAARHCRSRLSLPLIVCRRVKRRGGFEAPAPLESELFALLALPALSMPWVPLTRRMALTTLARARSARRFRRSARVPRATITCAAEKRTVEQTTTKRATTQMEKMSLIDSARSKQQVSRSVAQSGAGSNGGQSRGPQGAHRLGLAFRPGKRMEPRAEGGVEVPAAHQRQS